MANPKSSARRRRAKSEQRIGGGAEILLDVWLLLYARCRSSNEALCLKSAPFGDYERA